MHACAWIPMVAATLIGTAPIRAQQDTPASWRIMTIDPVPGDCGAQMAAVQQALVDFDVPSARVIGQPVSRQFGWIVICDERTWFRLRNSPPYARLRTRTGMTDFTNHVVYLNGFGRSASALRDTVAHEMGHMLCRCAEEDTANDWKFRLMDQAKARQRQIRSEIPAAAVP